MKFIKRLFSKELFYRREIEIFWSAGKKGTTIYGIREVYRSRFSIMRGGLAWRLYSERGHGNIISITYPEIIDLLEQARHFVVDRSNG